MKINAIITAGGTSSRFGRNKLLEKVHGKEVIKYTLEAFEKSNVDEIIICSHISIIDELKDMFKNSVKVKVIEGGNTRQQSVYNGLKAGVCDYVLIHDGARPMISAEIVNNCIEMVKDMKALTVATKTIDTIKEVENGKNRSNNMTAQNFITHRHRRHLNIAQSGALTTNMPVRILQMTPACLRRLMKLYTSLTEAIRI